MSRVQLANMTDEELLRHAYMEKDDPLVQELCARVARLIDEIATLRKPAILLFYGDHRPSIAGLVDPGGDRDTPYVLLRFGADGALIPGSGQPRDLSPAQLHHLLADTITT